MPYFRGYNLKLDIMLTLKRSAVVLGSVGMVLFAPLVAMQFSSQVDWDLADFLVAGALLALAGFAIDFTLRRTESSKGRLLIIGGIVLVLLLIWIELAVGIFGSPFTGN